MAKLLHIGVIIAAIAFVSVNAKNECDDLKEQELQLKCDFTDFEEYRNCIKERKELRRKRATICPLTGKIIDIDKLSGTGDPHVSLSDIRSTIPAIKPTAEIPSIQSQAVVPPAVLADQPLHAQSAPHVILSALPPEVNHNWVVEGADTNFVHNQRYHPARNVTTVIKLTNHINNTNIVNVPTLINATNINNITVYTNSSENTHDFGFGSTKDGPCCMVVKPRTCHTGPQGVCCHHKRHKMCGDQCTSRVMHARSHRTHGVSYIPQPSPRCVYTNQWPFVNCGYRRRDSCDGCYDHYDNYMNGYYASPNGCNGCYDEGFEYGQMYRRGPVLRPHFMHRPPPYYQAGYQDYGYSNNYYRGYYDQPDYMPEMYPPNYRPEMETQFPEDDFSRENQTLSGENTNGMSQEEADWGITMQKCRVISNDGSVTIANCTLENDHPYAAAPTEGSYPRYNNYYPQPYPGYYYPGSQEMYSPPYYPYFQPGGFSGHRRQPTNHKIAPLTSSKKSSKEELPRPIEKDDNKIPEDDVPSDDEDYKD